MATNAIPTIQIVNGVARHPLYRMAEPIQFTLDPGEHLAITGPNGAGKSILVDTILGRWPLLMNEVHYHFTTPGMVCDQLKYIAFRDVYGEGDGTFYYQQRWNSQDLETTPVARTLLPETGDEEMTKALFALFHIEELLDKHIVLLSSGELRKLQLTKALMNCPSVLIIDNPFIGLDAATRVQLTELLTLLAQQGRVQLVLILPETTDIPAFITHVVPVRDRKCGAKQTREEYLAACAPEPACVLTAEKEQRILDLPYGHDIYGEGEVVNLHKVSIRYGQRTILDALDWTVQSGEKWALSGENGTGKSTLLSLVCADNPQSYACHIDLFGRRRGTGESIWEIKKRIGYVSPEMHRAYLRPLPAIDIVASGLHDSVGLYRKNTGEQAAACEFWMDIFGVGHLKDVSFLQLSSGEQRLVLLARAFVKDPDLLVLDEPLHGLDMHNRRLAKDVIEAFCHRKGKTLLMVTHYQEDWPSVITHHLSLGKRKR
jgi:molybdate transport system ATP-binding protein